MYIYMSVILWYNVIDGIDGIDGISNPPGRGYLVSGWPNWTNLCIPGISTPKIGGIVMDKTNNSSWMVATSKIWNTGQTNMALPIKPLGHSILNCLVLWTVWIAEWKIDVSWHHHPIPNEKTNRVEHQHVLTPTASLGNSHWNWLLVHSIMLPHCRLNPGANCVLSSSI
jgi:hypothetical protein